MLSLLQGQLSQDTQVRDGVGSAQTWGTKMAPGGSPETSTRVMSDLHCCRIMDANTAPGGRIDQNPTIALAGITNYSPRATYPSLTTG